MVGGKKKVLATRRQTLRRLVSEIQHHTGRAGREVYEVGRRLAHIRDQRLYEEDGFETFSAFAEAGLPFSRRQANKLIRIAENFNAAIAARYGIEKLDLMVRLLEATPEEERPGDLLAADIRIRGEAGRFDTLPLHDASVPQIREAISLLRDSKKGARRAQVPAALRKRARSLAAALPPAPTGLGQSDRVALRRGKDGHLAITFRNIPLDSLATFITALQQHLP